MADTLETEDSVSVAISSRLHLTPFLHMAYLILHISGTSIEYHWQTRKEDLINSGILKRSKFSKFRP